MIVYLITNKLNGKKYVGQSVTDYRFSAHIQCARGPMKYQFAIHRAIAKYGEENFAYEVVQEMLDGSTQEELNEAEAYWVRFHDCMSPRGYNLREGGGSKGRMSMESRKKISEAGKGRKCPKSPEHIARHAKAVTGKKHTDAAKEKVSLASKGREVSGETRKKISDALKGKERTKKHREALSRALKGREFSEEWIANLKAAQRGRPGFTPTEETKKKISDANKGRKLTDEQKRRQSEGQLGLKHSEETKRKMAETRRKYWADKRAREQQVTKEAT